MPILSNEKCKNMFLKAGRHEVIPEIFMCAGYENGKMDSCQVFFCNMVIAHYTLTSLIPTIFIFPCIQNFKMHKMFKLRVTLEDH